MEIQDTKLNQKQVPLSEDSALLQQSPYQNRKDPVSKRSDFFSINWFTATVLCVLLSLCGYAGYMYFTLDQPNLGITPTATSESPTIPINTPRPSPTPIILAPGKGEYIISHKKSLGPRIEKVTFDPLDVKNSETLRISTMVYSDSEITSMVGTLQTDTKTTELIFTRAGAEKNAQIWATQLTIPDTLWYQYILTITAHNIQGSTTVTVAPRS